MTNEGDLKPDLPTQLPGENFDADKQCELVFGAGYKKCNYMVSYASIALINGPTFCCC